MVTQMVVMIIQTLLLWFAVIWLHRQKKYLTLVPLYCALAILTLLTHNLSDLGFAVTISGWFFLISSFSFFTSLMLGILLIYLFEGPRATRMAIGIVLGVSFVYIGLVWLLGLQADTSKWVALSTEKFHYYFWSVLAIVVDIFFVALAWELLGKIKNLPLMLQVFLVTLGTYLLDTAIFVTGHFGGQSVYRSILEGNILTRFILTLTMTPIISYYLNREGFSEEGREKPKNFWEILNFKSDLETRIVSLESLEKELRESKDKYSLALEGTNVGIWDWDIEANKIAYSPKFYSLLGYLEGELGESLEDFKKILNPEDLEETFKVLEKGFREHSPYLTEYRLKTKDGSYRWFQCGGVTRYNGEGKPMRMVGSIIDINEKKQAILAFEEKVKELEKLNKLMIDRELKMVELKAEIKSLKDK